MAELLESTPARAIKQLQDDFTVSTDDLAGALHVSPRTVKRWLESGQYPQRGMRVRLAALIALDHHLRDTFESPEAIQAWLHANNRHLGGLSPVDAMRAGRVDRVEAALEALDSGIFV
jgi:uncharacterized protein (DUF2384 family)